MDDNEITKILTKLIKDGNALKNDLYEAVYHDHYSSLTISHNRALYQIAEKWKLSAANLLYLRFGKDSYYLKQFEDGINTQYKNSGRYCKENVAKALGVLEAVKDAMDDGMTEDLFFRREVLLFGDLLEQANEFLKRNFDLAAAIYGRVVLETVVKEFAARKDIKEDSFDKTIIALKKADIISQPMEHSLRANYAIGSAATHNKEEFQTISKQDIKSFLDFIRDKVLTL